MGCPCNKKQWWIFKWEGPHDWVVTWIGRWAFEYFEIKYQCSKCETEDRSIGIEGHSIVRRGFDLGRAKRSDYWGTSGYDPRKETP